MVELKSLLWNGAKAEGLNNWSVQWDSEDSELAPLERTIRDRLPSAARWAEDPPYTSAERASRSTGDS